ncbi:MAG TPA: DUF4340 domain-containing protein [Stellaceae bacterium]|nr:DUF4340 domain-containing protein [Stellaceae bacterium]
MRRRGLFALLALALAMTALAAAVAMRGDRAVSFASAERRALPGLADRLAAVDFVRLSRGAMSVNLKRRGERWTAIDKGSYPADQQRVRMLLLQLAELDLVEPKTDRPELLARLNLDDPANGKSTLVALQDKSAAPLGQLIIGRARPSELGEGAAGVYVRDAGSDQAWLARGAFDLGGDALSWLDRRIIDIAPARIASVVLGGADGGSVVLARLAPGEPFAIDGLPPDVHAKPGAALAAPAGALDALDLADVMPVADAPAAPPGQTTAAFTTFDGLILALRVSPAGAGDWLTLDATGAGQTAPEAAALAARLAPWRFAIPPARAKLLRMTLPDLLLPRGS